VNLEGRERKHQLVSISGAHREFFIWGGGGGGGIAAGAINNFCWVLKIFFKKI